ncbi:hypothetical protein [Pedobacter sp. UBA4863]|uniref:hypothetical protein n=1 Tax=Pedobacter sp. UBA4863 TaxID=1947060 RepID=UPI0025F1ACD5|nr:hypothetical protein [Pedobacter sp. UBA4863]
MTQINYKKLIEKSKLLNSEEFILDAPVEIELIKLKRPVYHTRVPIENKVQVLSNSLYSNNFIGSILVAKNTLVVIDGWQRVELQKAFGHQTISCYLIECSFEKEIELHLAINQQASVFDLQEFGVEFQTVRLEDFGFSEIELNDCRATMDRISEEVKQEVFYHPAKKFRKCQINTNPETIEKISFIKSQMRFKTNNQVLQHLITFYENNKSNN